MSDYTNYVESEIRQQRKRQVAKYAPKGILLKGEPRQVDLDNDFEEVDPTTVLGFAVLGSMTT